MSWYLTKSVGMRPVSMVRTYWDSARGRVRRSSRRRFGGTVEVLEARLTLNAASSVVAAARSVHGLSPSRQVELRLADSPDESPGHGRAEAISQADSSGLPASVDLRGVFSKTDAIPYDQLSIGSCTANAVAAAIEYKMLTDPSTSNLIAKDYFPSRLFLYYNARFLGGSDVTEDGGSYFKDALQSAEAQGITSEGPATSTSNGATWPYGTRKIRYKLNPGASNYLAARQVRVTGYTHLDPGLGAIQSALAAGQPVMLVIGTYQNFPATKDDWPEADAEDPSKLPTIPLPRGKQDGSHAILVVGYDDSKNALIILNSWGKEWGGNGYAYLPYDYVNNPKWADMHKTYVVNGVAEEAAPDTIGGVNDLVSRARLNRMRGLVHIDTALAGSSGTMTSFDFFKKAQPSQSITPLLFSYNPRTSTYTLTGIGQSFASDEGGAQGIPFVTAAGSDAFGPNTAFGFVDGRVQFAKGRGRIAPNQGVIPFSNQSTGSAASWLTSTKPRSPIKARILTIGETFSSAGGSRIRLAATLRPRFYSAMMVE